MSNARSVALGIEADTVGVGEYTSEKKGSIKIMPPRDVFDFNNQAGLGSKTDTAPVQKIISAI